MALAISVTGQTNLAASVSRSQNLDIIVSGKSVGVLYVSGPKGDKGDKGDRGPAGSGITSLNGLTGIVSLYGTGNIIVTTQGSGIYISGSGLATDAELSGISGVLSAQTEASGSLLYNLYTGVSGGNAVALSGFVTGQIANLSGWADQNFVHRTGDELISGYKTFASGIAVNHHGIDFINQATPAWQEGRVFYDSGDHALSYYNDSSAVTVNLGQEMLIRVTNKSSVNIPDGSVVLISGAQGNRPTIQLAIATGDTLDLGLIAVATQTINDNQNGYATTQGLVKGLTILSSFSEGDALYLSPTVSGGLTNIPPSAPNSRVVIGTVLSNNPANGVLYVQPHLDTSHIAYLHDVWLNTGTLTQGQLLQYNGQGYWVNVNNPSGVLASGIAQTGQSLYGLATGISGVLNQLIVATSGGVSSLNGASGAITLQGAGNVSVIDAGQTLVISGDTGAYANFATHDDLTALEIETANTVQSLSGWAEQFSGVLAASTAQTGQAILSIVTGLSGFAQGNFATQTALFQTGSTLYGMLTGLSGANDAALSGASGVLNQTINATGSGLCTKISGVGSALSGQLMATGQTLYQQTTGLSGYLIDLISATSAGVTALNGASGVLNIYGTGAISVFTEGQTIWVSGEIDAGAYATTAFVTGVSGFLQNQINLTGANSILYTSGASGVLANSINAMSGWCTLTSGVITSGLAQTGSTLNNRINALSGWTDQTFVHRTGGELISGTKQFVSSPVVTGIRFLGVSGSGIYVNTLQDGTVVFNGTGDGVMYIEGNTTGILFSVVDSYEAPILEVSSDGAVTAGAFLSDTFLVSGTGVTIGARHIPSDVRFFISGDWRYIGNAFSGNQNIADLFYPRTNPSGFISGLPGTGSLASTGQLFALSGFVTGVSGALNTRLIATGNAAVAHANSIGATISGNLTNTGITLWNRDLVISGTLSTGIIASGNAAVAHANSIGATISGNVTQTGITLWNRDLVISGVLATGIAATGQASVLYASGISGALDSRLVQTGQSLYALLTGASGQALGDYATKTQLTNTGVSLGAKIDVLSGYVDAVSGTLNSSIVATGTSAVIHANGIGSGLSGALYNSGAAILGIISTLSGFTTDISGNLSDTIAATGQSAVLYADSVGANTSGTIAQTGALLVARDDSISGVLQSYIDSIVAGTGIILRDVVYTSGTQFISGTKYFIGNTYIDNLYVTGTQFVVNTEDIYVGNNWMVLNATGGARDSAIFVSTGTTGVNATGGIIGFDVPTNTWRFGMGGYLTDLSSLPRIASITDIINASGGLEQRIVQTGQAAINYATSIGLNVSGALVAVSGSLADDIFATGVAAVNHANSIGATLSGNLTQTGITLCNKISALSGYVTGKSISFYTGLIEGYDTYWISYLNYQFPKIPVVSINFEVGYPNNTAYFTAISGRSTTGFYVLLSDVLEENGNGLNVIASY